MEFGQKNYSWNWFIWFYEFFGHFLKLQKKEFSQKNYLWNWFIRFDEFFGLDFLKFSGPSNVKQKTDLDFLPAWKEDKYHLSTFINRSSGVVPSVVWTNKSGWAKKSLYISSKDLLSRIKVGKTIFVRSMPIRTWDNKCVITDPWLFMSTSSSSSSPEEKINKLI